MLYVFPNGPGPQKKRKESQRPKKKEKNFFCSFLGFFSFAFEFDWQGEAPRKGRSLLLAIFIQGGEDIHSRYLLLGSGLWGSPGLYRLVCALEDSHRVVLG
jgi:hypothetical protein